MDIQSLFEEDYNILVSLKSLFKSKEIRPYAIKNLSKSINTNLIDYFFSQLIYLVLKHQNIKNNNKLNNFLLTYSSSNLHFTIKSICYLKSLTSKIDNKYRKDVDFLIYELKHSNITKYLGKEKQKMQLMNNLMLHVDNELEFLSFFEEISDDLITINKIDRNSHLRRLLQKINGNLKQFSLYFPNSFVSYRTPYKILRIVLEESHCLDSNKRVPFLMCLEIQVSTEKSINSYFSELLGVNQLDKLSRLARNKLLPPNKYPDSEDKSKNDLKESQIFGEIYEIKKEKIKQSSKYKDVKGWNLISLIFKGGEDLRQEHLAMQLILIFDSIWKRARLPLKLYPYNVMVTSENGGILETVLNAVSIDHIKKKSEKFTTLLSFYKNTFTNSTSIPFKTAQRNFVESIAAYSLITYFLNVKDRHNGNILINSIGSIIHIDFGFFLSNSPGGNVNFETAPFKLTSDDIELMKSSEKSYFYKLFKNLIIRGFLEARKHWNDIILIVDIINSISSKLPCLYNKKCVILDFLSRFHIEKSDKECIELAISLIEESENNWSTIQYDTYQKITNGIM